MSYREVLSQAYSLTIRNPLLWLFGLVMLGGFNLSLVNVFSFVRGNELHRLSWMIENSFVSPAAFFLLMIAGVAAFLLLNLIKIIFIAVVHNFLHVQKDDECNLCVKIKGQSENVDKPLPYFTWLKRVMLASALTIALTAGITLAANMVLAASGYESPVAVVINLLFVAVIACVVGTWNIFTSYFVVLHGLNFKTASAAAVDLIAKHARRVAEFVILISIIYTASVVIGNAFIQLWQGGLWGRADLLASLLFMIISVLWLVLNNAFFNVAFLIFFDKIVKATPVAQSSHGLLPANRVN